MKNIKLRDLAKDFPKSLFLKEAKSDTLIIVFPCASNEENDGTFSFYKTFQNIEVNCLFLSYNQYPDWSLTGVKGLGDNIEEF